MRRLRNAPRAPLVVAAISATPLFFMALMAMSLAVEKPAVHHVLKNGKAVVKLGDPSGTTEATIWLLAFVPTVALVLVGTAAMLVGRTGIVVSSLAAIAETVALMVPLRSWERHHTARFPVGVDLIPPSAGSQDIYLRGEWEASARHTAVQVGTATIAIAALAIAIFLLFEFRRRRGLIRPVPPPPPEIATGEAQLTSSRAGQRRL